MRRENIKEFTIALALTFGVLASMIYFNSKEEKIELSSKKTQEKIEEFYKFSGIKGIAIDKVVYFDWGPKKDKRELVYYKLILKINSEDALALISSFGEPRKVDELFYIPVFLEKSGVNLIDGQSYHYIKVPSPDQTAGSIVFVVDDRSDFSYVYIDCLRQVKISPQ